MTCGQPPPECDVPKPDHTGRPRLYPCGWRCTAHAPGSHTHDQQNGTPG